MIPANLLLTTHQSKLIQYFKQLIIQIFLSDIIIIHVDLYVKINHFKLIFFFHF